MKTNFEKEVMCVEIIASCILSSIIAYTISVSCAKYYLNKLNEDWKKTFDNVIKITIKEIKRHMSF